MGWTGRLVAVPLRDKGLEATQVTLVQLSGPQHVAFLQAGGGPAGRADEKLAGVIASRRLRPFRAARPMDERPLIHHSVRVRPAKRSGPRPNQMSKDRGAGQ